MALRPKHRREIRDLLRILLDDKAWQPVHTDRLLGIIRESRSDVADEVEIRVARDAADARRAKAAIEGEMRRKLREIDKFRSEVQDLHAKVFAVLEACLDLPMLKCRVKDPETGEWVYDPTLMTEKDLKIALQATNAIAKITGANAPAKIDVGGKGGSAFDLLDAIEVSSSES